MGFDALESGPGVVNDSVSRDFSLISTPDEAGFVVAGV